MLTEITIARLKGDLSRANDAIDQLDEAWPEGNRGQFYRSKRQELVKVRDEIHRALLAKRREVRSSQQKLKGGL